MTNVVINYKTPEVEMKHHREKKNLQALLSQINSTADMHCLEFRVNLDNIT